jgi:DNA gyrase subunit A
MLVTDQAKLIRTSVGDIRVIGRNTQGVMIFRVAENEHVVSAARIEESEDEAEDDLRTDEEVTSPEADPQVEGDTAEDLSDGGEAEGPPETE